MYFRNTIFKKNVFLLKFIFSLKKGLQIHSRVEGEDNKYDNNKKVTRPVGVNLRKLKIEIYGATKDTKNN